MLWSSYLYPYPYSQAYSFPMPVNFFQDSVTEGEKYSFKVHSLLMRVDSVKGKTTVTSFLLVFWVTTGEIGPFVQPNLMTGFGFA